jgi:hypothetical protein
MGRPVNKKYFGNTTSSGTGGYTITAITVNTAGKYRTQPTIIAPTTLPDGVVVTADIYTTVKNTSYVTVVTPGSGYAYNDVLTVSGGTLKPTGLTAQFTVKSTVLTVANIVSGGHGYAVNDQLTITNASGVDSVIKVEEIDNGDSTTLLSGASITGTGGEIAVSDPTPTGNPDFYVGQLITISGTGVGGDGSIDGYADPTTYKIKTVTSQTSLVLETLGGGALTTVAGPLANYTLNWTPGVITDVSVLTGGSRVSANPSNPKAPDSDNNTRATGATFNLGWGLLTFDTNPTRAGGYKIIPTNNAGFTTFNGVVTIDWEVTGTLVTNGTGLSKNHGYAEALNSNVCFSNGVGGIGDAATVNAVTHVISTTGNPTILGRAYINGSRRDVDIVKQRSSRRYKIKADNIASEVAKLVDHESTSNSDFNEMDITAYDSQWSSGNNHAYWVLKIMGRKALIVRKNPSVGQFADPDVYPNGQTVHWVIDDTPELNSTIRIESN